MTPLPRFCTEFFALIDAKPWRFPKTIHQLRERIVRTFETEDLIVYMDRFDKYMKLGEHLGYAPGYEWERFKIGLSLCVYEKDPAYAAGCKPRWRWTLDMIGRGAGKDIEIAWIAYCLISPYNPVKGYDVDIFGVVEKQATRPVKKIVTALEKRKAYFQKWFHWTLEGVRGKDNGGSIIGHANNPDAANGLQSGCIIFNEAHTYVNANQLGVGKTGLGKVDDPRMMIFTSNGKVVGGPLDDFVKEGKAILEDPDAPDNGKLYFLWALETREEVENEESWHKANPSLAYQPVLLDQIRAEYLDWKADPIQNADFMTMRMGLRQTAEESPAAEWEDIEATNRPLPLEKLRGQSCTVGIDFAQTTDWVGVNLHFIDDDGIRYDLNHAWICRQSRNNWRLRCDYKEWARAGHCTIVDAPEIDPDLVADWLLEKSRIYRIECVVMDSYRYALLARSLERIGFSDKLKNIKMYRPSDIMRTVPVITRMFVNRAFVWGDNPCLRWAANNTKRVPAKRSTVAKSGEIDMGNFLYDKIEPQARKTDPFMALVASMTEESRILPIRGTTRERIRVVTY